MGANSDEASALPAAAAHPPPLVAEASHADPEEGREREAGGSASEPPPIFGGEFAITHQIELGEMVELFLPLWVRAWTLVSFCFFLASALDFLPLIN